MRRVSSNYLLIFYISIFYFSEATAGNAADPLNPDLMSSPSARDKERTVIVDCDDGDRLSEAIARQTKASTFLLKGTCREGRPVVVDRGDVTIAGLDEGATLVGGGIHVRSALGVAIRDFTIRDVPGGDGIAVLSNAQAQIAGMTVLDGRRGIVVEEAVAEIANCTVERQVLDGILNQAGRVFLRGTIIVREAGFIGIVASNGATTNSNDPNIDIEVSESGTGFQVQFNSAVTLPTGILTSRNNRRHGILVAAQSAFGYGSRIVAKDNGQFGLVVLDDARFTAFTGLPAQATFTGNTAGGIVAFNGGNMTFFTSTTVTDNIGPGLIIDTSIATLNNMTIRDNQSGDVVLNFGSTVTFGVGNQFGGPIFCEEQVLVRGSATCQAGIAETSAAQAALSTLGSGHAKDF